MYNSWETHRSSSIEYNGITVDTMNMNLHFEWIYSASDRYLGSIRENYFYRIFSSIVCDNGFDINFEIITELRES